jgi:O-antigen ligase
MTVTKFHLPKQFKFFLRAMACSLVIALPFDNAFFHLFTVVLFVAVSVSFKWTGFSHMRAALIEQKEAHGAFAAIWAAMLIANLINGQSDEAWRTMLQFAVRYWLLFAIFGYLLYVRIMRFDLIFGAALIGLAMHFLPFAPSIFDLSLFETRFRGLNRNPNITGFQAAFLFMLSLYLVFGKKSNQGGLRALGILLCFLALSALMASGNRSSWVAVGATAPFLLAASYGKYPKLSLAVGAATIGLFALAITQVDGIGERFALLLEGNSTHRFDVWKNVLNLYIEKPIFGHGLDVRAAMLDNHFIYSEHNVVLSVMVTMGTVGLMAYLWLIGIVYRTGFRNRRFFILLLVSMMLIRGMFAFDFYRKQIFVGTFVLLGALALHRPMRVHAIDKNAELQIKRKSA